jgi:hypothetical protein
VPEPTVVSETFAFVPAVKLLISCWPLVVKTIYVTAGIALDT